ncbi:MAG: hypothetical protein IJ493_01445 [Clostridia bacterium]|nr:hypothetical protein [Clostridia bacterium]
MKKKLTSTLLLTAMLASLAACGEASGVSDETTTGTDSADAVTTDNRIPDDLPEEDFGGYNFRFFTWGSAGERYVPDSENGDIVNDAVYRRNRVVEERFNVTLSYVDSGAANVTEMDKAVERTIMAGDEAFDLILNVAKHQTGQSLSGMFVNLYDLEYLDFSKPWWSAQLVEDLSFNGKLFVSSSNMHYDEFAQTKVFFFNKDLIDSYKLESPYSLVSSGAWTLDKMIAMTKDIYEDKNGNSERDESDVYGLLTTQTHNAWSVALNIPEWEKTGDKIELVALSDKMVSAFDKIFDWNNSSDGVYAFENGAFLNEIRTMFIGGNGLFAFGTISDAANHYRDADVEYGIVPFPKYDENQENYRAFYAANGGHMFSVPKFASDLDRTGIIIEALSAEGYYTLIPVYYETALKNKYLRDEESVAMLDIITASRTISFSYCYDNYENGLGFGNAWAKDAFYESYATFYATRENGAKARIAAVVEAFTKE